MLWLKRQAHRQRRPCYLYAFSGAGDLHFGSTNMLKGGKVETLANPLDMFGLLNLQRLQVCKHMPRPLRKELELDLSQAGFRTLPNFAFPGWQFSNLLEFFILSMISTLLGRKVLDFLQKSFGGGTYLEDALAEVATKLQQEIWQNAVAQLHPTWYPVSLMI